MEIDTVWLDIFKYFGISSHYYQIEFNGSPGLMKRAISEARKNTETLHTYVHKINEKECMIRSMKRLNKELSPLKDENTKDPYYIRDMWEQYTINSNFKRFTNDDEIRREPEQVHAFLKRMESGAQNEDTQVVTKVA